MPDHNSKILSDLQEHVERTTGTPAPGTDKPIMVQKEKPSGTFDQTADLRDDIGLLVGGGYTSFSDENARATFARIASVLGKQKASDLSLHIFLQNQRPGAQQMKPVERVSKFYDISSSNAAVKETLEKVKAFGTGPIAGYTDSIDFINQQQQGTANNPNLAIIQQGGSEQQLKDHFDKK